MTTASPPLSQSVPQPRTRADHPPGSLRFDWAYVALSALFIAGLWVDGWAHYHGIADESFFTPWHFLFYSAFGLVALFTAWHQWRNVQKGYAFTRALPVGYWLSLVGVALFAVGGVGDMIWHTLFGIEDGSEALTSPTHLLLGIGMALVYTGPLRAAWARGDARGWRNLGPAIISSTLLLVLLAFFSSYANPTVNPIAARFGDSAPRFSQDLGVISILWQSALLAAIPLLLLSRWRLPFGAITFILTVYALMMTILTDVFVLIPAALVAGLIADVLIQRLRPTTERANALHIVAFAIPALYSACYFVALQLIAGIGWSIHVWAGAIFLSGVVGLLLSLLLDGVRGSVRSA
jgi:hypothetical protein